MQHLALHGQMAALDAPRIASPGLPLALAFRLRQAKRDVRLLASCFLVPFRSPTRICGNLALALEQYPLVLVRQRFQILQIAVRRLQSALHPR